MAGVSKLFVVGEPGGYMGSDGVNPIRLLDACIAFAPGYFTGCPTLREEARPHFAAMGIWQAEFTPLHRGLRFLSC